MSKLVMMINKHYKKAVIILVLIGAISFFLAITSMVYPRTEVEGTITKKLGSGFGRNSNRGRILIKEENGKSLMLENEDNLLMRKSDKVSQFQGDLKTGQEYSFDVVGFSIPALDVHPNILKYKLRD